MAVVAIFYPSILNQVHPTRSFSFHQKSPRCCVTVKLVSISSRLCLPKLRMGLLPGSFLCWISLIFFGFFFYGRTPSTDPKARRRVHGLSELLNIFAILRVSVKRLPHLVILFINLRVLTVYWDMLSFTLQCLHKDTEAGSSRYQHPGHKPQNLRLPVSPPTQTELLLFLLS